MERVYGYGGLPRKPLPPTAPAAAQALWEHADVQDALQLERELTGKTQA